MVKATTTGRQLRALPRDLIPDKELSPRGKFICNTAALIPLAFVCYLLALCVNLVFR